MDYDDDSFENESPPPEYSDEFEDFVPPPETPPPTTLAEEGHEEPDLFVDEAPSDCYHLKLVNWHGFVAAKLTKLKHIDMKQGDEIRVPTTLLHRIQTRRRFEESVPPPPPQLSRRCRHDVPGSVIDRIKIQTLMHKMHNEATSDDAHKYSRRSLFTFIAHHETRLRDQAWVGRLDALEEAQRQSQDAVSWIAEHMTRHRGAYTSN
ncbi:hypothetical protein LEN26_016733 [Aphanomyces euteiches]|nr:hypothetical protein LEN26_016733 [Aphanomyces euteiches]KAH9114542.1 hypothetical protein AeMF1_011380 [Aphanomyces euteiches]KAH9185697.1 hypothetical protein AeNC1_012326 [Aphanomyces euteiches]